MSFHSFHMVEKSPWPLSSSLSALIFFISIINLMHSANKMFLIKISLFFIILNMIQWWRDICREASFQGNHTFNVNMNMKWGMILFIVSEILFFFSFFWAFFHSSLSPDIDLGLNWPPISILMFNPYQIPLLNTVILLASGITVTWAHHNIIKKKYKMALLSLMLTVILGIYFSMLQLLEYMEAPFSISDNMFGTTFFVSTGFHGLHVIIGTTFLFINSIRMMMGHFSKNHHFSFEAAAWYWHFVDVVWLFLFTFVYWWSY